MAEDKRQATYPWGDGRRYNSYSGYFTRLFGSRIQKVAINAGFTCPNRDGTLGTGGCTFCNNEAFTPSYCNPRKSVLQQIEEGIEFHARRYRRAGKYLAYFQSYSNTYAPLERLEEIYMQALAHPDIIGIIVGTRPDTVDERKLDFFERLARTKYVAIEYGVESCYDQTLEAVGRGHDFAVAQEAIEQTARRDIHTGAHFILGLPGESEKMLLEQAATINALPLDTVKFHQLQIFKGTPMAADYAANPDKYHFWPLEEYIDLFIKIARRLRPSLVIERFASEAPPRFQVDHPWGLVRNEKLQAMLESRLTELDTFQGELYGL